MFKSFIMAAAIVCSTSAVHAHNTFAQALVASQQVAMEQSVQLEGLNWKVGDENNYKLNMGGFINGTMKMFCREIGADGIWLVQDVDL
ncbi:MAG: hypothetical protein AB7F64_08455 [Gammaproteobacteria bacterium]